MAASDPLALIESLRRTRESLENLLTKLQRVQTTRDWTVSEETHHRRARRAVRKIANEYLPWARLTPMGTDRAAEIAFWLNGIWSSLPLEL